MTRRKTTKQLTIANDLNTDISLLRKLVIGFRDERNWAQFHTPKDLALAITIEASELAEVFLWKDEEEILEILENEDIIEALCEEIADILIFILYLADTLNIDITEAITKKLYKNAKKYPIAKAYGNAKKYTEYCDSDSATNTNTTK